MSNSATISKPFFAESRVVGERQPEVARAHDRDRDAAVDAEDLAEVPAQLLDVVADASHAELAEVREVLSNLRGVEMELLGKPLRRHGSHARRIERVEAAQIHRQAVGRELRDRVCACRRRLRARADLFGSFTNGHFTALFSLTLDQSVFTLQEITASGATLAGSTRFSVIRELLFDRTTNGVVVPSADGRRDLHGRDH